MIWLLTALSLLGVVLNIKKNRWCFVLWAVTNFTWAVIDFQAGIPAQGVLFTVYFFLSIWGLIEWNE
jgi:nicotinamide riboside transporter PnuC